MSKKIFILSFSFSLFFMASHSHECFAQRFKQSGAPTRTVNTRPERSSGNNTISNRDMNSGNTRERDFSEINRNNVNRSNFNNNDNRININNSGNRTYINNNVNVYHGYHYSGYQPYYYHPYNPYHWGTYWHPVGFFTATLATTAIMISMSNQNYYYNEGVYYVPSGNGYTVVTAPVGAVVTFIPSGYSTVFLSNTTYYYYGGTFYIMSGNSYNVVSAPVGAVVNELPEGANFVEVGGVNLLNYNGVFYQPVSQNGEDAYEVVQIQN